MTTLQSIFLKSEEMKLADQLNKNFIAEGVKPNSKLSRSITNFVMMRKSFLIHKKHGSKRLSEENLNFRILTIKRLVLQQKKDSELFGVSYESDLVEIQILIAFLEKACLIVEKHNKQDTREALAFDFHLWSFLQFLKKQSVAKPVECLSVVLQKSNIYSGMGVNLSIGTIKNKITKIQQLVDKFKELGGCHEPLIIGHNHRVSAPSFLSELSLQCESCQEKWMRVLGVKTPSKSSLAGTREYLIKKIPTESSLIQEIYKSLVSKNDETFPLDEIIQKFPEKSKIILEEIFTG